MGGRGDMSQCQARVTDVRETARETESSKQRCKRTKRKLQLVNFLMGTEKKSSNKNFSTRVVCEF